MQVVHALLGGNLHELTLPTPFEEVVPGVPWGSFDELMTPAYWRVQAWQHSIIGTYKQLRFGRSLREELAACLLGGFGMPAELGLAAYTRIRGLGLLGTAPTAALLEEILSEPLVIGGRQRTYRFPRQKARYLASCLEFMDGFIEPTSDVELRDALTAMPGIGLKTASWIVRNYRGSNLVAVIDIHILRAGRHVGLFEASWNPVRNYHVLECAFINFAVAIGCDAAELDALMWDQMRRMPSIRVTSELTDLFQRNSIN